MIKFDPLEAMKNRISASGREAYLRCGEFYKRVHLERTKRTRVLPLIGLAIHSSAEVDNLVKKLGEGTWSIKDAKDYAVSEYDKEIQSTEVVETPQEISDGRDVTADGASKYKIAVSPSVRSPVLVEEPVVVPYQTSEGIIKVSGILDLSDRESNKEIIRELKTGRKRKSEDFAHASNQLTTQGLLFEAIRGSYPARFFIDSLTHSNSKGWQYEVFETKRDPEDYLAWWEGTIAVMRGIQAGIFPPAQEGSWWCGPSWCPFFRDCKYTVTRRKFMKEGKDDE